MKRTVRAVVRLIASGLLVLGGMELGVEWLRNHLGKGPPSLGNCITGAVLLALGIVLFATSGRLADRWSDDFDE
jgi:hypothetical protein